MSSPLEVLSETLPAPAVTTPVETAPADISIQTVESTASSIPPAAPDLSKFAVIRQDHRETAKRLHGEAIVAETDVHA